MIALTINHGAESRAWSGGQANRVVSGEAFDGFFASILVPFSEARNLNCLSKHSEVEMNAVMGKISSHFTQGLD